MSEMEMRTPTTPVELAEPFRERIKQTYNNNEFYECGVTIDALNKYSEDLELKDEYMVRTFIAYRIGKFALEGGSGAGDKGVEHDLMFCGEFMSFQVVRISDILIGAGKYSIRDFCLQFDTEVMDQLFVPLRAVDKIRRTAPLG